MNRIRENIQKYGCTKISDIELISEVFNIGIDASTIIMNMIENQSIHDISIAELTKIKSITKIKATRIIGVLELGKRIPKHKIKKVSINNPWAIYENYMEELRYLKQEKLKVVLLNTKNEIIKDIDVTVGTLNTSIVHPRETFREAIKMGANAIILLHNHPSGNITPSNEDKRVTQRLKEVGRVVGIEVLDHIIIGDGKYLSFKQEGIF